MLPSGLAAGLAPGTVISGKYRVERPLGTGGMGVVLAAKHLELNQHLAIKVLLPDVAHNEEANARFLREGRSAAQITSPHVAKVHDTGRLPSGAPYLVMELLHGRDLRAHLADVGRVPLAQAIEWVLQAAHALAEAHALNIIHRDVKPANLFLAETSAGQLIKVLDFGISKQLDSTDVALTNTATAIGTPRYMAPEQMRSPKLADPKGDLWSLGIVLYELTTGHYPFQGDSITALCFDIMERTPVPPSQLNPELSSSFDAIVARCLEKDPSDRFPSMAALASALCALVPGARSSGLFNTAALQPASVVAGTTPMPVSSTPDPEHTTNPTALGQPLFADLPPQETMRSWDTTAVSRPVAKKAARIPLLALGIGIGVASATLVGLVIEHRRARAPVSQLEARVSSAAFSTRAALVVVEEPPVEASAPPSLPPSASEVEPTPSATAKAVRGTGVDCRDRFMDDGKGRKRVKPGCYF